MPREVTRDEVRRLVQEGAQLAEVLPEEEFGEGHLPGAVNLPLKDLAKTSRQLDRERPVVTYCQDQQ